jgi:hypothetical protein
MIYETITKHWEGLPSCQEDKYISDRI